MSEQFKLSLPAAILININIMLGAGIFMNTLPLAKLSGLLGAAAYFIVGVLMLPLVITVAQLLKIHPGGSFYTFGTKEINKTTGFFAIWAYFIAKLASSTLMIHFFSLIMHQVQFPILSNINVFALDILIICIFTALNMLNLKSGMQIQSMFLILKAMPIFFVILSGIFLFTSQNISSTNMLWTGLIPAMPWVIYAFTGFESACSISRHIKNPDVNAPKAIFISYGIVILILCTYQFLFYTLLGPALSNSGDYFEAFPYLLKTILPISDTLRYKLQGIFQLAIASSALGGAYGILYSNNWNLYTLVENRHIYFSNFIGKLNKYNIPFICVIIEALICMSYLYITNGKRESLQQIAALGSTIAYSICAISLLYAYNNRKQSKWLPYMAIFNCLMLILFCLKGFLISGISPLIIFGAILLFGIFMFKTTPSI